MRYSQMSDEQRRQLLGEPANYPLRVSFLGKRGLLMPGDVELLRRHEVDFDVDDDQIEEILAKMTERGEVPAPPRGHLLRILAAILAVLVLLRRTIHPSETR